jgi:hypothetical protein
MDPKPDAETYPQPDQESDPERDAEPDPNPESNSKRIRIPNRMKTQIQNQSKNGFGTECGIGSQTGSRNGFLPGNSTDSIIGLGLGTGFRSRTGLRLDPDLELSHDYQRRSKSLRIVNSATALATGLPQFY